MMMSIEYGALAPPAHCHCCSFFRRCLLFAPPAAYLSATRRYFCALFALLRLLSLSFQMEIMSVGASVMERYRQ
jgi:hypothetical protein